MNSTGIKNIEKAVVEVPCVDDYAEILRSVASCLNCKGFWLNRGLAYRSPVPGVLHSLTLACRSRGTASGTASGPTKWTTTALKPACIWLDQGRL